MDKLYTYGFNRITNTVKVREDPVIRETELTVTIKNYLGQEVRVMKVMEKKRFKAYKPPKACIMSAMVGMVIGAILGHYVPELDLPDVSKAIIALFGYAISGFAGFIIAVVEGLVSDFKDGDV